MRKFNKSKALKNLNNKNNNRTKKYSIIISIVILVVAIIYFSFARFEANSTYSLISGTIAHPIVNLKQYILNLKTMDLQYDGEKTLGEYGTPDNNLRYVGSDPDNYVYFNCNTNNPNEMNEETCEVWRIIGIMTDIEDEEGVTENRIAIIRNDSIGMYSWDSSSSDVNDGSGINQWGASGTYEGADLMRELNTDYLGNITVGTDGKWYNSYLNNKNNPMPSIKLNSNAQQMIETVKWYTGASDGNNKIYAKNLYAGERNTAKTGKECLSGSTCNDNVNRTGNWVGKVGLMYYSDIMYAIEQNNKSYCFNIALNKLKSSDTNGMCLNQSWIYSDLNEWTLSIIYLFSDAYGVASIDTTDAIRTDVAAEPFNVRPVVYLKQDVMIAGGNGTDGSSYKLIMQ